jgi:hypothetical protein
MPVTDDHALGEAEKMEADFKELGFWRVVGDITDIAVGILGVGDSGNCDFWSGTHGGFLSVWIYTMLWGRLRKSR